MFRLFLPFSIFLICSSFVSAQGIFINEFQASNESTVSDSFGEFDDWIELYNYSDSAVILSGLFLSDDYDEPDKWQLPDSLTIAAGSFKIFWADDQPQQGNTHLGFRISDNKEQIILSGGDSLSIIDHIEYGQQYVDISFGRHPDPDSAHIWKYFSAATPGQVNSMQFFEDKNSTPFINMASGYYNQSFSVEITADDVNSVVLYTTDSEIPDHNSTVYNGPIQINSTTVLRAIVQKDGFLNSDVQTRTYIFEEPPVAPSVFLVTAYDNMWGAGGIYAFRYNEQEKPVHFEYYDQNKAERYQSDGGIKIHSPDGKQQQSFRLYARTEYGNKYFRHKFFDQKDIAKFKRLVLRNAGNDGIQVNKRSHLRDMLSQQLFFERNNQNAISAFKTVNVFLNGEFWGLYNLRERQDEYYIAENYPYEGDLDLLERSFGYISNRNAITGDWQAYDEMKIFMRDNDISLSQNYTYVKQLMDVDNFAEYWIFEIFAGNFDWLLNNIRFWKARNNESKWRWMMWDMDHGFGLPFSTYGYSDWNTLDWSTSTDGERTNNGNNNIPIRKLLENENFKLKFINLFADLLNTTFKPANIHRVIDELANKIETDAARSFEKYESNSYQNWHEAVQSIKDYADERPHYVKEHIIAKFGLESTFTLTLNTNNETAGSIKVNTIAISENNWQGEYFKGIPVLITHNSARGYNFNHWIINSEIITDDTLYISDSATVAVYFEIDTIPGVIVSEINYHSSDELDAGDWVEIYNPKLFSLDISGWIIKDSEDDHSFTFPANTVIDSDSFLVIADELSKFSIHYPGVRNVLGGLGFGLNNSNDQVRIYTENNILVDLVEYFDEDPWPAEADGNGYTLALTDLDLNNLVAENWRSSYEIGGTPEAPNVLISALAKAPPQLPEDFKLLQNYPNPFNAVTRIEFFVPRRENMKIAVFNNRGQLIMILADGIYNRGNHSILWNAGQLSTGIYFIRQITNGSGRTIKSMLLK